MLRKELYSEILNKIVDKAGINGRAKDDILDDLLIDDHMSAYSKISSYLIGVNAYLDKFAAAVSDFSVNPGINNEEDLISTQSISIEVVDPSRCLHLHRFIYNKSDLIVVPPCFFFKDGIPVDFKEDRLWRAIETIWLHILDESTSSDDFFSFLLNENKNKFYLLKAPIVTTDAWRIYSGAYYSQVINEGFDIPSKLKYHDHDLMNPFMFDWNNKYEQYHDVFNMINEMKKAEDLLSRFLRMYQILEFFTFRFKLKDLSKGQATRNSFIANVRNMVNNISRSEREALEDLFKTVFRDIHKIDIKNDLEPVSATHSKFLNTMVTKYGNAYNNVYHYSIQVANNDKEVAKVIYNLRCSIVHSKESELHFTFGNIDEYKGVLPLMKLIVKVMEREIVKVINDSSKKELEFTSDTMMLY